MPGRSPIPGDGAADEPPSGTTPAEVLEILGDEYTRRILQSVSETGRTGREISKRVDVSRTTVYRRLKELRDHGLIETDLQIDPDGHHRKWFRAAISRVEFDLETGELVTSEVG